MILGDDVKGVPDIWRSFNLFEDLLVSFNGNVGGVWFDKSNSTVMPWGLVL